MVRQHTLQRILLRALWLVGYIAFTSTGADASRRSLSQAPASALTTSSGSSIAEDLLNVLSRNQSVGPVVYKTAEAALYTTLAYANETSNIPLDNFTVIPLNSGGQVLVAWVANGSVAVLSWRAPDNATDDMVADSVQTTAATFLTGDLSNARVNNATADPFQQVLQGSNSTAGLEGAIANISGGAPPRRVLCTGLEGGGSYATLAAVWAATNYPLAQIRLITFGAPAVGDELFNWGVRQLLDLNYPWSTPGGTLPALPIQLPLPDVLMYLQDNTARQNSESVQNSLANYVSALQVSIGNNAISTSFAGQNSTSNNSTLVDGISNYNQCGDLNRNASSSGGIGGLVSSAVSTVRNAVQDAVCSVSSFVSATVQEVDAARGYLDGAAEESPGQTNATFTNIDLFSGYSDDCPPLLCKMRAANVASCQVYYNNPGIVGAGSRVIHGDYSTDVGVAWDAENTTGLIAFRGSQSIEDWIQDFKQFLVDSPYSTALEDVYPGVHVHTGFLQQLQAVTDKAPNTTQNIGNVLMDMSGGVAPSLVIVTGHSLGAGVASLAATWAALQWPAADIRCVTFGNPKPGNGVYSEAFQQLVGRQYRLTNHLDVVPELPTYNDYVAVGNGTGLWATNNTILLQERPSMKVDALTWDDHSCNLYEGNLIYTPAASLPANIAALANATMA